jgi:RNA polymerase sigma factor (sigma-70 family)
MSAKLMGQIAAGSRAESDAAFSKLVAEWQSPLTGYAYKMLQSWDAAEDVVQSVMLSVFQHAGNFREIEKNDEKYATKHAVSIAISTIVDTEIGENSRFSGWLYAITKRRCIDVIRRRKRDPLANRLNPTDEFDPLVAISVDAHSALDAICDAEDVQIIKDTLVIVSGVQRATFELHAEGFSLPEIADASGVCLATVKGRHRLAKAKIRERLTT